MPARENTRPSGFDSPVKGSRVLTTHSCEPEQFDATVTPGGAFGHLNYEVARRVPSRGGCKYVLVGSRGAWVGIIASHAPTNGSKGTFPTIEANNLYFIRVPSKYSTVEISKASPARKAKPRQPLRPRDAATLSLDSSSRYYPPVGPSSHRPNHRTAHITLSFSHPTNLGEAPLFQGASPPFVSY
jgi:hypothetical protein